MKKFLALVLTAVVCCGCCCGNKKACPKACEIDAAKAGTPENVLQEVAKLFAEGRVGYAADKYMAEGGDWNGYDRDEFVATENILLATQKKDLQVIFEQAQYLDDSGVDAARSAELIKSIPKITEAQKDAIFAKCQKLYDRAQQTFKTVATMKIVKKVKITCNTVALVFTEKADSGAEYTFVAVMSRKDDSWKINDIFISNRK